MCGVSPVSSLASSFRPTRVQQITSNTFQFVVSESEKNGLRTQVNKLEQELQFGRELLIRKTNEFHIALEDLAGAHRIAEDGRVNALQELETKKFETADLQVMRFSIYYFLISGGVITLNKLLSNRISYITTFAG